MFWQLAPTLITQPPQQTPQHERPGNGCYSEEHYPSDPVIARAITTSLPSGQSPISTPSRPHPRLESCRISSSSDLAGSRPPHLPRAFWTICRGDAGKSEHVRSRSGTEDRGAEGHRVRG
eukprot:487189-Rhodomonas_salina.2